MRTNLLLGVLWMAGITVAQASPVTYACEIVDRGGSPSLHAMDDVDQFEFDVAAQTITRRVANTLGTSLVRELTYSNRDEGEWGLVVRQKGERIFAGGITPEYGFNLELRQGRLIYSETSSRGLDIYEWRCSK